MSYDEQNPEKMIVSKQFYMNNIKKQEPEISEFYPKYESPMEMYKTDESPATDMFEFVQKNGNYQDQEPEVIKNSVYVCIIKSSLILLKEKWHKWEFLKSDKDDQEQVKKYKVTAKRKIAEAKELLKIYHKSDEFRDAQM